MFRILLHFFYNIHISWAWKRLTFPKSDSLSCRNWPQSQRWLCIWGMLIPRWGYEPVWPSAVVILLRLTAKVSNPACDSPVSFCMFGLEKSSELFSIMQIWWLWSTTVYNWLNNSNWAISAIKPIISGPCFVQIFHTSVFHLPENLRYQFDICNNFIDFDNLHILIIHAHGWYLVFWPKIPKTSPHFSKSSK